MHFFFAIPKTKNFKNKNEVQQKWEVKGKLDGNIMRFEMISKHSKDYSNECKCFVLLGDKSKNIEDRCINGRWEGRGYFNEGTVLRQRNANVFQYGGTFEMKRV